MRTLILTLCGLLVMLTQSSLSIAADEKAASDTTKRCLPLAKISHTRILDNQHIVFYMHGGPDYVNNLPRRCSGLRRNEPFMYKTSLSQLCDLDMITVLHSTAGELQRGVSCGLGKFEEYHKPEDQEHQTTPDDTTKDTTSN